MTNTMIIAVAAIGIVVLALLVFLFLKKRNQDNDTAYLPEANPSQNPKLGELLQSTQEATPPLSAPAPVVAQSVNPLEKIELLTQDQRYDEAVGELKRFLMTHPKDEQALLKLLQTYGITNNRSAFHQLHSKIHEIGSPDLVKQADFCRSLLEDDLVEASKAQLTTNTIDANKPNNNIGLEFESTQHNEPQVQMPSPVAVQPQEEESFELEDFGFDDSPSKTADIDGDFDLSFQDNTSVSNEVGSHFDFDFEEKTDLVVSDDKNTSDLNEILFENSHDSQASAPKGSSSNTSDALSFDDLEQGGLSFGVEQSSNETLPNFNDDLDFGLELDNDLPKDDTLDVVTQRTDPLEEDNVFILDDLSFDDLDLNQTQTPEQSSKLDEATDTLNFDDFEQELSFDEPQADDIKESTTNDVSFAVDELDFSSDSQTVAIEPPTTQETSTQEFFLDTPISEDFDAPISTEQEKAIFDDSLLLSNVAADKEVALFDDSHDAHDTKDIHESITKITPAMPLGEFVPSSDTDTPTITLELAQQYLNLGEQDSAKRLLQEVSQSGSPEQQQKANALLAKL